MAELLETQEEPAKVMVSSITENQGLDTAMLEAEESLSMIDEIGLGLEDSGRALQGISEIDFQQVVDGEMEEDASLGDEKTVVNGDKAEEKGADGKSQVLGDGANRQGARKKNLKPVAGTGASNKLKMAQLVNVKCPTAKPGIRHGESSKQVEDKGTSNPKSDPPKN